MPESTEFQGIIALDFLKDAVPRYKHGGCKDAILGIQVLWSENALGNNVQTRKTKNHCEIMFVLHAFVLWMMRMIEVEDEKAEDHDMEKEEDDDVEEEC